MQLKNRINVKENELTQIITSLGPKFKTDHETIKKLYLEGVTYYKKKKPLMKSLKQTSKRKVR